MLTSRVWINHHIFPDRVQGDKTKREDRDIFPFQIYLKFYMEKLKKDKYAFFEKNTERTEKWILSEQSKTTDYFKNNSYKKRLFKRLEKIKDIDEKFLPVIRGEMYFFRWRKKGEQVSSLYMQKNAKSKQEKILDCNAMFKKHGLVVTDWTVSKTGKLLSYSVSKSGNDKSSIHVIDIQKRKNLTDFIPEEIYPEFECWMPDESGFYYSRNNPGTSKEDVKMQNKIYFHRIGHGFANDRYFFGRDLSKTDRVQMKISDDGNYFLVTVFDFAHEKENAEIYLGISSNKKIIRILGKENCLRYPVLHRNCVYILSNKDTPHWKIEKASVKNLLEGKKNWRVIIKENKNRVIESFSFIQDKMFLITLENVSSHIGEYTLSGKYKRNIKLPAIGTVSKIYCQKEGNELFFAFSSFVFPKVIYNLSLKNDKLSVFFQRKISNSLENTTVRQHFFKSKDGVKVPMFLIHKKTIKKDGNNPLLCYGYGGFGTSLTPSFDPGIIPFLEDGGIYAEINIRGGGEFGEKWHEAGKLFNKQNSFDDFISGIKYLYKNKYSRPEKTAIFGWSNGGLLVGAVVTQEPEICKVAVIGAPVLDMEKYYLFDGGRYWIHEYGNPKNKRYLENLLSYSPYHNIQKETSYPSMLILSAREDDRVHPMHAYKFVAKMRDIARLKNPLLLRLEEKAGHSGANGMNKSNEQQADILSFIYKELRT
ncbi:MAG: Prolyl oligopeptidase [Parcubacteria group bacterium GW2011_GWF2_39_8b]|uniref:prolyl oligopeptidase n=3 Tax=Candidatus Zambryskiibacteriota TaxID=1817925 RepID=A0A1G2T9W4_9BACT|nr:MAG: Prolyl oligopeptidase [Parcubacteria group bacterium GW2011_GWF2_39_8b]KKR46027.1 MAG: Prolyl oligopeptidase [Parcubacteria group bacterium GW2011_GWA2_40_14]OHA94033.1 MAG: hypothetical protein A2W58_03615 [Candidatus Zambryskibacteria bacterium RIFCSPHIGHO2_02_38_10.5]OHA95505.1 MAG: hypothetical protein A3C63_00470 [Candidatus Zambryskibacteria bacterium RIFCSPHIGHO2_02_FULL_39_82]OHA98925.1 MAG: hypothetical protein A3E32_01325 [Candidatus Zambryskibacteria bacterium RIFCSPHIGHO2_12